MGNSTFNKNLFLEIYAGEITEEFETNFVSKFGIAYKDFLELELKITIIIRMNLPSSSV